MLELVDRTHAVGLPDGGGGDAVGYAQAVEPGRCLRPLAYGCKGLSVVEYLLVDTRCDGQTLGAVEMVEVPVYRQDVFVAQLRYVLHGVREIADAVPQSLPEIHGITLQGRPSGFPGIVELEHVVEIVRILISL